MEEKKFTKLSNLIDGTFTVEKVEDYVFKRWNPAESKMETSLNWQEGFRKIYPVSTDKGLLDMGSGQIGSLLESVFHGGAANLIGKTFKVKSNGKHGMEIRYFFSEVRPKDVTVDEDPEFSYD